MKRVIASMSARQPGFSLVELMISITLGLLIVAATLSIFASNKQAYRTTENLGRVQENARMSFELIGNDVREASGTQCSRSDSPLGNGIPVISALSPSVPLAGGDLWSDWANPLRGLRGTGPNDSDTLQLKSGGEDMFHVNDHDSATATANINTTQNHTLQAGDIVMMCDYRQGAIFQVSGVAGDAVTHTAAGLNTTANLGPSGLAYEFSDHATISRINVTQWFVANNGRGGNSLFRTTLRNVGGNPAMVQEEIADGVFRMQLLFLLSGNYVRADAVPNARWRDVTAVRTEIIFESADAIGTGGARIQRPMIQTFNLRNRMQ